MGRLTDLHKTEVIEELIEVKDVLENQVLAYAEVLKEVLGADAFNLLIKPYLPNPEGEGRTYPDPDSQHARALDDYYHSLTPSGADWSDPEKVPAAIEAMQRQAVLGGMLQLLTSRQGIYDRLRDFTVVFDLKPFTILG